MADLDGRTGARTGRLLVVSYNVHRCIGTDGCRDVERVASVLGEIGADVVGLQEVDSRPSGRNVADQLDQLAGAMRLTAVSGPTLERREGYYGNALLTRGTVAGVRRIDLSYGDREPRGALDVDVDIDGTRVRVLVTHLGLRRRERRDQVARLLRTVSVDAAGVIVLLGDFNEWLPWSAALRLLRHRFRCNRRQPTFPSYRPLLALDRIWVRPAWVLGETSVYDTELARRASDHLPLGALVGIGRGAA